MIIVLLTVLGLCLGSFVNALVWRVNEQETAKTKKRPDKRYIQRLSVTKGRSMCPACHHELSASDLLPVLSWLSLGGKCRYCHQPIGAQYPLVELLTAGLFAASYIWWPLPLQGFHGVLLGLWLILLTGLLALAVYDLRWFLLPNRMLYPLFAVAGLYAATGIISAEKPLQAIVAMVSAVAVGGGIFYVLFQFSAGKWIGGGDVKLGWLLGLVVASPAKALLFIFIAALGGSLLTMPMLLSGRLKRTAVIPFGPFLIAGAIITVLFGQSILDWYQQTFLSVS